MGKGGTLTVATGLLSGLKKLIPDRIKQFIKGTSFYIKHRSVAINIYHCCVPKAGSQWIRAILSDPRTYRYSGLMPYSYQDLLPGGFDPRRIDCLTFSEPFPENRIVTPLYIDFDSFAGIPKPPRYRAFFVMRDPRDLVGSSYFSIRNSHAPMGEIPQVRKRLKEMSVTDGLLYIINRLHDGGDYVALRSWAERASTDNNVLMLRFEELTVSSNLEIFKALFSHCDIGFPEKKLEQILQTYSFIRLSGRQPGEENRSSHYRKGEPGDWKNHFDETVTKAFKDITGDLLVCLGYVQDSYW